MTYVNLPNPTSGKQEIYKVLSSNKNLYYLYRIMITTQGDREMHSNISINLSRKSNSKKNYSSNQSYSTDTRTYTSKNSSSQSLYAQAMNGQLKSPTSTRRTTHSTNTISSN
jgi:hypothetical protein